MRICPSLRRPLTPIGAGDEEGERCREFRVTSVQECPSWSRKEGRGDGNGEREGVNARQEAVEQKAETLERFSGAKLASFQAPFGFLPWRGVVSVEGDPGRCLAVLPELGRLCLRVPRDRPRATGGSEAGPDAGPIRRGTRAGVRGGLHPAVLAPGHGGLQGVQRQRREGGECNDRLL